MPSTNLVKVAVFLPLQETYTYRVPDEMSTVQRGCRVEVQLGRRKAVGVVVETDADPGDLAPLSIKSLLDVLDENPVLDEILLDLVLWTADYYMAPPGEALRTALPTVLHARRQEVLRLTPEGRRVLGSQAELLRSSDDDLSTTEQQVLQHLQDRGGAASPRSVEAAVTAGGALPGLVRRGLVTRQVSRKGPAKPRTDLVLSLVEPVDLSALARAKRQVALVEALRAAGGTARLGALKPPPKDGRVVARSLAKKGVIEIELVEVSNDPFASEPVDPSSEKPPRPTEEQQQALDALLERSRAGGFSPFLLFGVTSSGKTEVYLRLIADALDRGQGALVLVPEISLTPQLAARFRARFGDQVAVLHSGLTEAERFGQWRRIRAREVRIVVGARSAVFAPLSDLGVVIVDEEHDPSFKQQDGVRYNGRDVALVRAQKMGAVIVLGSATPSFESFHGAGQGRLTMLLLKHRATPRPLPNVEIVDVRRFHRDKGVLSAPLAEALIRVLEQRQQAILFLNRRGFSPTVLCKSCGFAFRCRNCSVTLTYHRFRERIVCHYCGFTDAKPTACPQCDDDRIGMLGIGTEQVEELLQERFPDARVARLDRDTAQGKGLRSILGRMGRREVDILVGTQMVTKGHDFPNVTLVGVICADMGLHFPDFRAAERTFQLLAQVAGRAGRGDQPGQVLIQTYNPDHPSLKWARVHDFEAFFTEEVETRLELSYPPGAYLASVHMDGPDERAVTQAARRLAEQGHKLVASLDAPRPHVLGPAEAPIQKLKGRVRWMLLVKGTSRPPLRWVLVQLLTTAAAREFPKGVRVTVDIDPISML